MTYVQYARRGKWKSRVGRVVIHGQAGNGEIIVRKEEVKTRKEKGHRIIMNDIAEDV
jgi:hypothetical protein